MANEAFIFNYNSCKTTKDYMSCAAYVHQHIEPLTRKEFAQFNCGWEVDPEHCNQELKDQIYAECVKEVGQEGYKANDCLTSQLFVGTFKKCMDGKGAKGAKGAKHGKGTKRAANLSGDASSSLAIWATIGVLIFILICAIVAYWYLCGGKKAGGRPKGSGKSGKSKMAGKSKYVTLCLSAC